MNRFARNFALAGMFLAAAVATPSAFAHVTYHRAAPGASTAGVPADYDWTGGTNADVLALQNTLQYTPNNLGYEGVHSATNDRYIATGTYAVISTVLGTNWGGITGNLTNASTLLGQTYAYNNNATRNPGNAHPMSTSGDLSVAQGSWNAGVSTSNTGLSWGSPHFSSGTGNPELNLLNLGGGAIGTTRYINITVGDDPLFAGTNQLAFTLYQGWANGGLSSLIPLYTGTASSTGQDIGVTLMLTGNYNPATQTAANAGEYTLVFGDISTALNNPNFDGHYRYALDISGTAAYGTVVSAVPVPAAVWLFGSAVAGLVGFRHRKAMA